ncbi:hypothetical protein M2451_003194 [Dysgonomonas sp. PFB1-18]|uniref:hypothetical protein n=1 Tax=unclassified Dysgonomonas TaxID=2630389 RepID=UPI0024751C39|nr:MULTISPECIES: hypothetical protein [unclassified Dysgonomonas]MDH6310215.1 hypothetical protein [Dysgonomonas sp. PF1-14]MDH6340034.1 hypothetical protein [Dysgonomonas sp. PF1-16]MDH6381859.1 hypothetical protein [Dysgonomonas sp. PFB1-18]MDH6398899.1 hypothetical protein [Dysgonomonas sp. PF1-23]
MKANNASLQPIERPNLLLAIILSVVVFLTDVILSEYVTEQLGIDLFSTWIFVPYGLLHVFLLLLLGQYLTAIDLKGAGSLIYAAVCILLLQVFVYILLYKVFAGSLSSVKSSLQLLSHILVFVRALTYVVVGGILFLHNEYYVGGLRLLGIFTAINGVSLLTDIAKTYYTLYMISTNMDAMAVDSVAQNLTLFSTVAGFCFVAAMFYVFTKGYLYNEQVYKEM